MLTPLSRRSLYLRLLRLGLAIGGFYDLVLAALLALAPSFASLLLSIPMPSEPFYVGLLVVLVSMAAAVYLLAAYDPMAYAGNVLVAIGGRFAAAVVMAAAAAGRGDLAGLYVLAAVDFSFAVVHAACWWPCRHLRAQLL